MTETKQITSPTRTLSDRQISRQLRETRKAGTRGLLKLFVRLTDSEANVSLESFIAEHGAAKTEEAIRFGVDQIRREAAIYRTLTPATQIVKANRMIQELMS